MRWRIALAFGLVVAAALALAAIRFRRPPALPPAADRFVLVDVSVVEPARGRRQGSLAVAGGRLVEAGDLPADAPRLTRYAGATVLPGLADMHTHLPTRTPLALTEHFGLLYLAHGVTTVRDAGDLDATAIPAARDAIANGHPMPRVRSCGPFVGGRPARWANTLVVEDAAEAPEVAARLRADGHACMKIYDELDASRIRALVSAARAEGLAAMGHVPFGLRLEEARIPDTQHLLGVAPSNEPGADDHVVKRIMDWRGVDDARIAEAVAASAALGIAHTPTLVLTHRLLLYADVAAARRDPAVRLLPRMYGDVVWSPARGLALYRGFGDAGVAMVREALPKKLRMVGALHEAGVALHVGTDTQQPFVAPGAAVWDEMRLFARAGIPVEEVWAHATWRAGPGLGLPDFGRLSPSASADLLIFREDPTRDLSRLDSLEAVVVRGRLYERAALEQALERSAAFYRRWLVDRVSTALAALRLRQAVTGEH